MFSASFDTDSEGFVYEDDAFDTNQPAYAGGTWVASGGFGGTGGLQVMLGGVDAAAISGMSGGWRLTLDLGVAESGVTLFFRHKLDQSATYEYDESTRMLVKVDGVQYGRGSKGYVDHIGGDGASTQGNSNTFLPTTDWQWHRIFVGNLAAGTHTLILGGSNNKKDAADEVSTVAIDDVWVTSGNSAPVVSDRQAIVDRLSSAQFASYLQGLTSYGDRCRLSSCPDSPPNSYFDAQTWIASQLTAMGYTVQYHNSTLNGGVSNLYVTKVGAVVPGEMYIVSAHLDGRGGGAAYDDDGSGAALLLSAAEVFAGSDVETDKSVRFIWWDKEEGGLYGAGAYVQERRLLQGTADEPVWLGVIQHDMILYDHGAGTAGPQQSPYADLDVEWRSGTAAESQSRALALEWRFLNGTYSTQYPATAYNYSTNTDDTPFHPYVASVSVRENRRSLTSGSNAEWINPNYHTPADAAGSYSALDLDLGFNAVQNTVGTVAELVNAHLLGTNSRPTADAQSVTTDEGVPVAITLTGSDPDSDPLTYDVVSGPAHGTLSGMPPNLTYSPAAGSAGADSFTFVAKDGKVDSLPATVSITVNSTTTTTTFISVAAQDGYVLESGENTNVGGSLSATAATTSALRAGDDNKDKQYKLIVSFDTSPIPDGATILSATVRLLRGSLSGTSPFTTHGTCWADVQTGGFSGSTALETGDFQAVATAVQAASLTNAASNGSWSEGSLNAAGLLAIDKTGTTQLRVYFNLDDNDDNGNDYLGYYSGESSTSANRPQLVVTYQ
ncbi:MAG TPA: M28 family peptidase [Thermoanaerobaculia bacterium]|nr:M28 family peptidase [Thermoanaerobaculia bacterium]